MDEEAKRIGTPLVHMNGSSGDRLVALHRDAARAVRLAEEALAAAYPNARDYYPLGDGALQVALAAHNRRMAGLAAIRGELDAIQDGVRDQMRDRARQRE